MIYEPTPERNFFFQKLPADATTIRRVQNSWWIVEQSIIQQTKWSWNTAPIILSFSCAYISECHINELRTTTTNTYNCHGYLATVDMKLHSVSVIIVVLLIIIATWVAFEKVGNTLRLIPQRCWIITVNRRRLSRFLDWKVSYIYFPFNQRFAESRKDKTSRFHRHGNSTPRTDVSYSEFLSQLPWKINLWMDKKINKRP